MALDKTVYLYSIIFFGISFLITFILIFISRKSVGLKIRSIFARRNGKILVNFKDESKGFHQEFVYPKQGTLSIQPPWLKEDNKNKKIMVGYDPDHIYFDSVYGIRAIDCNPQGSYRVVGYTNTDGSHSSTTNQAYVTGEMAEDFITRALCSPNQKKELNMKYLIMFALGVTIAIGVVLYFVYQNQQQLVEIAKVVGATKTPTVI